jgi:rubrerythrin
MSNWNWFDIRKVENADYVCGRCGYACDDKETDIDEYGRKCCPECDSPY